MKRDAQLGDGFAAPSQPSRHASDETTTREHVSRLIGQFGPITVAELAERLNITTAAVRRHLDAMLAEDLLQTRDAPGQGRRGRGRPAKAYVLSRDGHRSMPAGYDRLAGQAMGFLAHSLGEDGVRLFAQARSEELTARLRPAVDRAGNDPSARAIALAEALRAEGFAATARPVAEGTPAEAIQLCQGHCPVHTVATQFPQLCEAETEAFAELVGVDVRRLATLAGGDHVCTTHIPIGRIARDTNQRDTNHNEQPTSRRSS